MDNLLMLIGGSPRPCTSPVRTSIGAAPAAGRPVDTEVGCAVATVVVLVGGFLLIWLWAGTRAWVAALGSLCFAAIFALYFALNALDNREGD